MINKLEELSQEFSNEFQIRESSGINQFFMLKKTNPFKFLDINFKSFSKVALMLNELIKINSVYARSINIERDESKIDLLNSYIPTSVALKNYKKRLLILLILANN